MFQQMPLNNLFTGVIIQIRFEPLNCVEYTSTDALEKTQQIRMRLLANIVPPCSCEITSSHLIDSRFRCSTESPQTVTFRTQISGDADVSAGDLVPSIQQWIESSGSFIEDGVELSFNTSCSLLITSFDSDECPNAPTMSSISEPLSAGQTSGTLIASVVLGVLLLLSLAFNLILILWVWQRSKGKKDSYAIREQNGTTVTEINPYTYSTRPEQQQRM